MTTELPRLPFDDGSFLDLAPGLLALQQDGPITKVITAAGDEAWLVTRYDEVKELFTDPRLGRSHPDPAHAARITRSPIMYGAQGNHDTEEADHALMRSRLVPCFSARRMVALTPRVEGFVDDLLSDIAAGPMPCDLHVALSFALPVRVICDLLGIPRTDHARLHEWSDGMVDLTDPRLPATSVGAMVEYMRQLVIRRRKDPGDDIISELIAAEDGGLTDQDVVELAVNVLFTGHETTVARIDLGVLLIMTDPAGRATVLAPDPPIAALVEETLRLSAGATGMAAGAQYRYARTEIDIGGVRIERGDAVMLSIAAANRDHRAFPEPNRFDIARPTANQHLMFGHGARYCIGAALARIELAVTFRRLFQRFPALELAVPFEQLRWRDDLLTGGLAELPVRW
jgi:pentalenolactone synthase